MKHTYHIHGMTCNGCRSHVEKTLSEVNGVTKASVDLEKAEAVIEMEEHIPLEAFQKALKDDGGSYSITLPADPGAEHKHQAEKKAKKESQQTNGTSTYYRQ
ncbi:Mercuric transport protein periplasmic component [Aequorivita sp. CIP111184]|uniref:Heavy-metal-associated domain-containing protein n=1 Tax=Aequorivita antarctica TaxID=153266 RepID=A0A5C6YWF1_9FLAO|nr:heavy-metal-associated domain-containing protein [Aequorivita antarctica]SRX54831.1 Mercuric transport protein periplasmic component [Aequorivita sp. CIP111184]SRX75306.1 Mercuric transport protein periplasmic component [Aequorivita antarctica]